MYSPGTMKTHFELIKIVSIASVYWCERAGCILNTVFSDDGLKWATVEIGKHYESTPILPFPFYQLLEISLQATAIDNPIICGQLCNSKVWLKWIKDG